MSVLEKIDLWGIVLFRKKENVSNQIFNVYDFDRKLISR